MDKEKCGIKKDNDILKWSLKWRLQENKKGGRGGETQERVLDLSQVFLPTLDQIIKEIGDTKGHKTWKMKTSTDMKEQMEVKEGNKNVWMFGKLWKCLEKYYK